MRRAALGAITAGGVAIRYDKLARTFLDAVIIAAICALWL